MANTVSKGHCEGAVIATVTTPVAVVSGSTTITSSAVITTTHSHAHDDDDHDHDHDHEDHSAGATESLAPSPTASVGCEPHGDHCECPTFPSPDIFSPLYSSKSEFDSGRLTGYTIGHCKGPKPVLTSVAPTRVIANSTTTVGTVSSTPTGPSTSATLSPTGAASPLAVGYGALAGVLGLFGFLAL